LHNWASNGADAFRYLAVGIKEKQFIKNDNLQEYALT